MTICDVSAGETVMSLKYDSIVYFHLQLSCKAFLFLQVRHSHKFKADVSTEESLERKLQLSAP